MRELGQPVLPTAVMAGDLRTTQRRALRLCGLLWPSETPERAGLALAEEAGEVCRAILKREEARHGEGGRAQRPGYWTGKLAQELAQVVVVAAKIAEAEGLDLATLVALELDALLDQAERKGLV